MQTSPTLFPKTLLDIKVSPETVLDLYRNCGLPEHISEKLFADMPPEILAALVEITKCGLKGAHKGKAKVSDLQVVLRCLLSLMVDRAPSKGDSK